MPKGHPDHNWQWPRYGSNFGNENQNTAESSKISGQLMALLCANISNTDGIRKFDIRFTNFTANSSISLVWHKLQSVSYLLDGDKKVFILPDLSLRKKNEKNISTVESQKKERPRVQKKNVHQRRTFGSVPAPSQEKKTSDPQSWPQQINSLVL